MPHRDDFPTIFVRLRSLLAPSTPSLVVGADAPAKSSLDAPPSAAYPRGHFFGTVQVKKHDVGYHLMPVYVFADLLDGLPDRLTRFLDVCWCHGAPCPVPAGALWATSWVEPGPSAPGIPEPRRPRRRDGLGA